MISLRHRILITLLPLVWLMTVTVTAGLEKIFHDDPRIGFLAQAKVLDKQLPALETTLTAARSAGEAAAIAKAERAVAANRGLRFNQYLDAVVAGSFLALVMVILVCCAWEWLMLLFRQRVASLRETEPVWLPDYAVAEGRPWRWFNFIALALALARELSGERELDRPRGATSICACMGMQAGSRTPRVNLLGADADPRTERREQYLAMTEKRFRGINRCC